MNERIGATFFLLCRPCSDEYKRPWLLTKWPYHQTSDKGRGGLGIVGGGCRLHCVSFYLHLHFTFTSPSHHYHSSGVILTPSIAYMWPCITYRRQIKSYSTHFHFTFTLRRCHLHSFSFHKVCYFGVNVFVKVIHSV